MARKLLTSVTTQETKNVVERALVTQEQIARARRLYHEIQRAQSYIRITRQTRAEQSAWAMMRFAYHTFSLPRWGRVVQRMPRIRTTITKRGRTFHIVHIEPLITAELFVRQSVWQEMLYKEYALPLFRQIELEQLRWHHVREELMEREFEVTRLEPPYRVTLDITELARLELKMLERYGYLLEEAIQDVIQMCSLRQTCLTEKPALKALQKMVMQLYVPYFHAKPYTMNLLGIRLSPLTLLRLKQKPATYYIYGVGEYEMFKQKPLVKACVNRRIETKLMASSSGCGATRPIKFSQGYTEALTGEEKVGFPRDNIGKEILWMGLRYAYSMPYWLRRFIAHHTGMPENHKYARYFGIGCIPSRRKTWRKYERHFPEAQIFYYSVDKQIMDAIKRYRKRYRETYPERGKRRYRRRI